MINKSVEVETKKKDVTSIKLRLNTIIRDSRLLVPIEERVIYTSMVSVRGGEFVQRAVIEYCENPDDYGGDISELLRDQSFYRQCHLKKKKH